MIEVLAQRVPVITLTVRTTCRICDGDLTPVLSLGEQYLVDFPHAADTRTYPAVPLELVRCTVPACGLVQLAHTTPREWLYGQYWYRSGVNEAMRAELADVVRAALTYVDLPKHALVADIGANDGTLLQVYRDYPLPLTRVAWEPARNLYQACRPHCEVLFPEFFSTRATDWISTKAHVVTMVACFYDIDDPHRLVADVAQLLHRDGVWVIQQAYLPTMLEQLAFDNIVHEHLEYYHLQPLEGLLAAHGLEVFDVEHRTINGGSFRTYVGWKDSRPVSSSVYAMRLRESGMRLGDPVAWDRWSGAVSTLINRIIGTVAAAADRGETVDVIGASTKGHTLLQACGLDHRVIRQAWERSPEKVGRFYGATGIPIVDEAEGRKGKPDWALALAWQFRDGLVAREAEYLKAGGRMLIPMPGCEVVRG